MSRKVVIAPNISCEHFEDEALLVHLETGELFQLNHTGARVIQLLEQGMEVGQLFDSLVAEYEGSEQELKQEVQVFLDECIKRQLLLVLTE